MSPTWTSAGLGTQRSNPRKSLDKSRLKNMPSVAVSRRKAQLANVLEQSTVSIRSKVVVLVGHDMASLVVRAQDGDREAFATLTRAYLRPAYSVALAILGRPSDAEDIAQDSLLIAFERLSTCREPERFAGWLLQIVRNQARNALTSRRLRDVPAEDCSGELPGDPPVPEASTHRAQLLSALGKLTSIRREVVLLHDLEGWTHVEIAEALQISELMSRQHLFLARRELRQQLDANRLEVEHA
jgi:RNA polymerase sigma-70 factor, ECF subfamily